MRMNPLIGTKAWFGPRRLGWGLSPVSVEGWVATAAFSGVVTWVARAQAFQAATPGATDREDRAAAPPPRWWPAVAVGLFLLLVVLKGTSPGGPRARREFEEHRAGIRLRISAEAASPGPELTGD